MAEQLAFNTDCLEAMRKMKDNEFDLAIVDPPYSMGKPSTHTHTSSEMREHGVSRTGGTWAEKFSKKLLRGT